MAGGHFRNKYMSTSMKVGMCLIGKNEQSGLTEGMVGDKMRNRLLGALTVKQ